MESVRKHETEHKDQDVAQALERLLKVGQILREVMTDTELAELIAFLNSNDIDSSAVTEKGNTGVT